MGLNLLVPFQRAGEWEAERLDERGKIRVCWCQWRGRSNTPPGQGEKMTSFLASLQWTRLAHVTRMSVSQGHLRGWVNRRGSIPRDLHVPFWGFWKCSGIILPCQVWIIQNTVCLSWLFTCLSFGGWVRMFGGRGALGRPVTLNGAGLVMLPRLWNGPENWECSSSLINHLPWSKGTGAGAKAGQGLLIAFKQMILFPWYKKRNFSVLCKYFNHYRNTQCRQWCPS